MNSSFNLPRHAFRISLLVSFALLATACGDDDGAAGAAGTNAGTGGAAGASAGTGGNAGTAGTAGASAGTGGDAGTAGTNAGTGGNAGTTGNQGPDPVLLGTSENYVILAKSEISSVPTSAITGDVGLSPAAASYITGFELTRAGTKWTAPEITGDVFAADNDDPTPSNLTTAVADMESAYTDAAGRLMPDELNLGTGMIGGMTLTPGLYKWTSSVTIPENLTLSGTANDVWIFQISGDLSIAGAQRVNLSGGAQAKNIFWQVAGTVSLGTTAHFEGVVLSQTAITMGTGSSINGRLLAQTAINIDSSTVTEP